MNARSLLAVYAVDAALSSTSDAEGGAWKTRCRRRSFAVRNELRSAKRVRVCTRRVRGMSCRERLCPKRSLSELLANEVREVRSEPDERSTSEGPFPRRARSETACGARLPYRLASAAPMERVVRHATVAQKEKQSPAKGLEPPHLRSVRSPVVHIPEGREEAVGVVGNGSLSPPLRWRLQVFGRTIKALAIPAEEVASHGHSYS